MTAPRVQQAFTPRPYQRMPPLLGPGPRPATDMEKELRLREKVSHDFLQDIIARAQSVPPGMAQLFWEGASKEAGELKRLRALIAASQGLAGTQALDRLMGKPDTGVGR
jgi:hypothetical protein